MQREETFVLTRAPITEKKIDPKRSNKCWPKKILAPKKFLIYKILDLEKKWKKIESDKKFLVNKGWFKRNFWFKEIRGQNKSGSRNFGSKNYK